MALIERLRKLPGITKGMLGAMGFLGAAPNFIPYTVLEIVSLAHAIIVGWNTLMSAIWAFPASLLSLPNVPPEFISACVLGFSLSSTWAYSILKAEWGQHRGVAQNSAFLIRVAIALFDGPILLIIAFGTYPSAICWLALSGFLLLLCTSLYRLPKFRSGFFTVLGFTVFLEIIYIISTDAVRNIFDSFVCDWQSVGLPQCDSGS